MRIAPFTLQNYSLFFSLTNLSSPFSIELSYFLSISYSVFAILISYVADSINFRYVNIKFVNHSYESYVLLVIGKLYLHFNNKLIFND